MKRIKRFIWDRYGFIFLPIGSGMLILLITLNVLLPKVDSIKSSQNLVGQKKIQLEVLMKKLALLQSVTSEKTTQLLQEAETALPQTKDASSLLSALDNLSGTTQLVIDSINLSPGIVSTEAARPAPKVATDKAKPAVSVISQTANTLPIVITTHGTSEQLRNFLKQVQTTRPLFDIQTAEISFSLESSDSLSAIFNLNAYYLPPIVEIGEIDSQLPQITDEEQNILAALASYPETSSLSAGVNQNLPTGKTNLFK